jgi:hypothetical protein
VGAAWGQNQFRTLGILTTGRRVASAFQMPKVFGGSTVLFFNKYSIAWIDFICQRCHFGAEHYAVLDRANPFEMHLITAFAATMF